MNDAEIIASVLARDALRKESGLPRLDVEKEIQRARDLAETAAAIKRHEALCETYAGDRQAIKDAVIAEMRAGGNTTFPNGWAGNYHLHTIVEKRFSVFLAEVRNNEVLPV